jgi:hypothetical protein
MTDHPTPPPIPPPRMPATTARRALAASKGRRGVAVLAWSAAESRGRRSRMTAPTPARDERQELPPRPSLQACQLGDQRVG